MTKLSGTSGQLFSGLAESLNMRGTSRSGKGAGTKSQADTSFNDLLNTVSGLAKRALGDQGGDPVKAGKLHARLALPTASGEAKDEPLQDDTGTVKEPESERTSNASASDRKLDKKTEKSLENGNRVDLTPKPDLQDKAGISPIVGQQLAVPTPQAHPVTPNGKDLAGRDERSTSARRDVQATGGGKAALADAAAPAASPSAARAQGSLPQTAAATPTTPAQAGEPSTKPAPAAPGFEAIAANVEHAVKAAARETLPETTKVTVVQQETHLPPVQLSAPQQVANAVVAELKETPAATASAAPDLSASPGNMPDQPLKILTINLEPPALGNVTVRLRLVGTEVSVHLAAQRKDTSQMLDQQRDSIRDLMQSAGYVADVAPVQHGSLDGFQSGSGQSQPQSSGQQPPSQQAQGQSDGGNSSSGQSDGGARQARQERQSQQETRHDQDVAPQLRRGPVYL